ncbi:MAG: cyclic nucleotide-binding domain-containing protein [Fuerstiella sp.]|nr:cyclic nucleotide-binding domain-containing protein [Fuerstiella sp.]
MNNNIAYLKKCCVFEQLSPDQVLDTESQCFSRTFNRGETIYLPSDVGDSVLLLARGRVRIYHLTSGG